jgi:hypothetical protein
VHLAHQFWILIYLPVQSIRLYNIHVFAPGPIALKGFERKEAPPLIYLFYSPTEKK